MGDRPPGSRDPHPRGPGARPSERAKHRGRYRRVLQDGCPLRSDHDFSAGPRLPESEESRRRNRPMGGEGRTRDASVLSEKSLGPGVSRPVKRSAEIQSGACPCLVNQIPASIRDFSVCTRSKKTGVSCSFISPPRFEVPNARSGLSIRMEARRHAQSVLPLLSRRPRSFCYHWSFLPGTCRTPTPRGRVLHVVRGHSQLGLLENLVPRRIFVPPSSPKNPCLPQPQFPIDGTVRTHADVHLEIRHARTSCRLAQSGLHYRGRQRRAHTVEFPAGSGVWHVPIT